MFTSARIVLTSWYILILAIICISFSFVVFFLSTRDIIHLETRHRSRQETQYQKYIGIQACQTQFFPSADSQLILDWESQLKRRLITMNLIILTIAGVAAFFLATQTLKPIQHMLYRQQRFISDVSHELKTPITAMKTEIEVNLRDEHLNGAQSKEVLKSVLEEVKKLESLTNTLLTLDYHNTQTVDAIVSINQIVDQALKKVQVLAHKKQITLSTKLTDAQTVGSFDRLVELLVILLDNAIKYSETDSEVLLTTTAKKDTVEIQVVDQGVGIKDDELAHVFDRFIRGDKSRSKVSSKGFGLGLSIAQSIVEQHNGTITVKSKVGKGSLFIVKLPRS